MKRLFRRFDSRITRQRSFEFINKSRRRAVVQAGDFGFDVPGHWRRFRRIAQGTICGGFGSLAGDGDVANRTLHPHPAG